MRRTRWVAASTAIVSASVLSLAAAPHEHLNAGSEINHSECGKGKLVVNVVQRVLNDNDSGVAGNAWAFDNLTRQIQVVQLSTGEYCATVRYEGQFSTIAGPSPQNTGSVDSGVRGTFKGGYRSTNFTGTLAPSAPTRGSIGTFDYACDTNFNCPGYVDWTTLYFSTTSGFDLAWWGWVYQGGNNGSWVNSADGNAGDITGS